MSLKVTSMKPPSKIERKPGSDQDLRDALQDALGRIARLEDEVARLRGEVPPEFEEEAGE